MPVVEAGKSSPRDIHHRHKGIEVIRRAPGDAHTELHHYRRRDQPLAHQLLGEPQMARIKGLDLNPNTRSAMRLAISAHAGV